MYLYVHVCIIIYRRGMIINAQPVNVIVQQRVVTLLLYVHSSADTVNENISTNDKNDDI